MLKELSIFCQQAVKNIFFLSVLSLTLRLDVLQGTVLLRQKTRIMHQIIKPGDSGESNILEAFCEILDLPVTTPVHEGCDMDIHVTVFHWTHSSH